MNNEQTTDTKPEQRKRPKLVWIITICYTFSIGWSLLSFALIYSGLIPVPEVQKTYFESQTFFDHFLTVVTSLLYILGAILLFLLRRHAFHCFLTSISIGLLMTVYHIIFKNWFAVIGSGGLVMMLIVLILNISVLLYLNKLIKKGILK